MSPRFFVALVVTCATAAAAVTVACGGSSSTNLTAAPPDAATTGADGEAGPYTLDNVCERTAPIVCDLRKPCCTSSPIGYDEAGCLAQAKRECEADVADVRAGRAEFFPERIDACVPKFRALLASCTLTFDTLPTTVRELAACQAFTGQLPEGASCERGSQCKPGGPTDLVSCDDDTKKCTRLTLVGENQPCEIASNLPEVCDEGLYCDVDFGSDAGKLAGTCKKKTAIGGRCDKLLECGLGNYCSQGAKVCLAGKKGGASCRDDLECASVDCVKPDAGADAGALSGTCKETDPFAKPDECKGT